MSGFAAEFIDSVRRKAEQIERDKDGKALTQEEAQALRTAAFLRQIAPYCFEVAPQEGKEP